MEHVLAWLLVGGVLQAGDPDAPPALLDGSSWKITFPAAGPNRNALEIRNPEFSEILGGKRALPAGLERYFRVTRDALVFTTPYTGVTTSSGTKYSRTELREMSGAEENNWTLETGGSLECRLKVSGLKGGASKIIFMQIHGKAPESKPLLKCVWEKGYVRLLTKSGPKLKEFSRKSKYTRVGEDRWFICSIRAGAEALSVEVDGEVVESFGRDILGSWPEDNTYYFKAGNYLQHDTEGAEATVTFSRIALSH